MGTRRYFASCAAVATPAGGHEVVVAGGFTINRPPARRVCVPFVGCVDVPIPMLSANTVDDVEIFSVRLNKWRRGAHKLPRPLALMAAVRHGPDTFLLVGGTQKTYSIVDDLMSNGQWVTGDFSDAVYRYVQGTEEWETMPGRLRRKSAAVTAMVVPEEAFRSCNF